MPSSCGCCRMLNRGVYSTAGDGVRLRERRVVGQGLQRRQLNASGDGRTPRDGWRGERGSAADGQSVLLVRGARS